MKEKLIVNYKAVFKYPEHQESQQFQSLGKLELEPSKKLSFKTDDFNMSVKLENDIVYLQNNHTTLKLILNEVVENKYHSDYGMLNLETKLLNFSWADSIKINYALLENGMEISRVYILIQMTLKESYVTEN